MTQYDAAREGDVEPELHRYIGTAQFACLFGKREWPETSLQILIDQSSNVVKCPRDSQRCAGSFSETWLTV